MEVRVGALTKNPEPKNSFHLSLHLCPPLFPQLRRGGCPKETQQTQLRHALSVSAALSHRAEQIDSEDPMEGTLWGSDLGRRLWSLPSQVSFPYPPPPFLQENSRQLWVEAKLLHKLISLALNHLVHQRGLCHHLRR